MRLGRRDDHGPFRFDIEILALHEGPEVYARVTQIERDYKQFRQMIDLLPKKSGMSWEAFPIAMELAATPFRDHASGDRIQVDTT